MHRIFFARILVGAVASVSFGAAFAGPRLYVSDTLGNSVTVIDTATNARVDDIVLSRSRPLAPVVSPDGRYVYVQSVDGPIDVIDTATATVTQTYEDPNPGSTDGAGALTLSGSGSMLFAAAAGAGSFAIIRVPEGQVITHVTPDGPAIHIAALRSSHDGRRVYALDNAGLSITAIDVATGHTIGRVAVDSAGTYDGFMGMAVSPDDRTLYAATYYGQLVRIDSESLTVSSSDPIGVTAQGSAGAQIYGIALQPDGSRAFVAQFGAACVVDVDLGASSSAGTTSLADNNICYSVAAGSDGKHAYVASVDAATEVYSVVALDPADHAQPVSIGTFGYPNFDDQSISRSDATLTPRAGLWWTPGLPGSSFEIEVQNGTLVVVATTYDDGGTPTWRMASGPFDAVNGSFSGDFLRYDGGSCLDCAYRAPGGATPDGGHVSMLFENAMSGTLSIDGTTLPISKYAW